MHDKTSYVYYIYNHDLTEIHT